MAIKNNLFNSYLKLFQKKMGLSSGSKLNLYKYSSEFINFLKNDAKIDTSNTTLNISDILKQNFYDSLQSNGNNMDFSNDDNKNLFASFLKNMFKNADLKNILDSDKTGDINKDEFETFINAMDQDGDSNITMDEMMKGLNKIKDGSLNALFAPPAPTAEEQPADSNAEVPQVSGNQPTDSGNGGVSPDNNTNSPNNNPNTQNTNTDSTNTDSEDKSATKSVKDMSLEELNSEQSKRKNTLSESQDKLDAVYNGTNEKVKTAKEDLTTAQEAYDKAIESDTKVADDLKTQREKNLQEINDKNGVINSTKSDIAKKEGEITTQESMIAEDKSNVEALKSALNSLGSSDDTAKQKEINKKKDSIEKQIQTAEEKQRKDEEKLEALNKELQTLNDDLTTNQEALTKLETSRAAIEKEILLNCSDATKNALKTFNDSKKNLETVQASEESSAKSAIKSAKDSLLEVNNQINVKNAEKVKKDNKISSSAFAENVNYANLGYYNDDSGMSYLLIGPDDVSPDEELPMLVFLHGSGEASFGEDKLLQSSLPYTLLNGESMLSKEEFNFPENFRGYIVFPQLPTSSWWWTNDKAENCLRSIIGNISSTRNIDKDNIALAGHSMGGKGAVYMAKKLEDIVSRVAVISASNAPANIDPSTINVPVKGYYAAREGADYMAGDFRRAFGDENVTEMQYDHNGNRIKHGDTPGVAFAMDSDGNGRSDLFEWLFPDK